MKKLILFLFVIVLVITVKNVYFTEITTSTSDVYTYCKTNGYSTNYCFLVDFSKPSGIKRFYIYDFKNYKVLYKSLCANGLGRNYNIFKTTFSNEIGSYYSSLGKYKVGKLRPVYNPNFFFKEGYEVFGLDSSNSNAYTRGILIHEGNLEFETFPLPCLPVSKGCFAVSKSAMQQIKAITTSETKPILLIAYKHGQ